VGAGISVTWRLGGISVQERLVTVALRVTVGVKV
jgi:hypothetical protein